MTPLTRDQQDLVWQLSRTAAHVHWHSSDRIAAVISMFHRSLKGVLERRLVERRKPGWGRRTEYRLTPQGRELVKAMRLLGIKPNWNPYWLEDLK